MTAEGNDIERLLQRYRPAGPPAHLRHAVVHAVRPRLWPLAAAAAASWLIAGVLYMQTASLEPVLPERHAAHESLAQWLGGHPEDYVAAEHLLAAFDQATRIAELQAGTVGVDAAVFPEANR
jgi:hypothetical protein